MAAPEFMMAGEFTALGFTVAADFLAAGSMARLVDFTAGLLDFTAADLVDYTAANFTLADLTRAGSTIMAFAVA